MEMRMLQIKSLAGSPCLEGPPKRGGGGRPLGGGMSQEGAGWHTPFLASPEADCKAQPPARGGAQGWPTKVSSAVS